VKIKSIAPWYGSKRTLAPSAGSRGVGKAPEVLLVNQSDTELFQ
jgi:hypothetical protein